MPTEPVTQRRPFEVIDGGPSPESPVEHSRSVARDTAVPEILQCPRCGGRALIAIELGVAIVTEVPQPGVKGFICAVCLAGGENVRVW